MKDLSLSLIGKWAVGLLIVCAMDGIGNFVGYGVSFTGSLPGITVLFAVSLLGLILKALIPTRFPALVYSSVVGILIALPFSPIAPIVNPAVSNINLMAVVTPILAFAGMTVGRDFNEFKRLGWRAILVGVVVLFSAFFWACVIAEVLLRATHVI